MKLTEIHEIYRHGIAVTPAPNPTPGGKPKATGKRKGKATGAIKPARSRPAAKP